MLKTLFTAILEIIFPEYCVSCGKQDTLLCQACYEKLEFSSFEFEHELRYINKVVTTCDYTNESRQLVATLKYKSVIKVAKIIAQTIYRSTNIPSTNYFVPIPITDRKQKQRGFNQTEEISKHLNKLTKIPSINLLYKTKPTRSQMEIKNKKERKTNIKNSFTINTKELAKIPNPTKTTVTLVDDVVTTGSTINECARVLKKYNFKTINALIFAKR